MKSSAVNSAFALLLAASLAGKLLAERRAPEPDRSLFYAEAAGLLRQNGFDVSPEPHRFEILLRARSPGCTLLVGDYTPYGTFAEAFRQLAAPVGPLRFAWRGRSYERAPKLRPLLEYYGQRELRRIGLATARTPIVAFAASPGCDLSRISWQRLAILPG
ncbi:MAG: hypothetical protein JWO81_447 [Alphaproteobacteria bacterium]|nr:hypothetical protein [Alphaproteobacteria bacterium]